MSDGKGELKGHGGPVNAGPGQPDAAERNQFIVINTCNGSTTVDPYGVYMQWGDHRRPLRRIYAMGRPPPTPTAYTCNGSTTADPYGVYMQWVGHRRPLRVYMQWGDHRRPLRRIHAMGRPPFDPYGDICDGSATADPYGVYMQWVGHRRPLRNIHAMGTPTGGNKFQTCRGLSKPVGALGGEPAKKRTANAVLNFFA